MNEHGGEVEECRDNGGVGIPGGRQGPDIGAENREGRCQSRQSSFSGGADDVGATLVGWLTLERVNHVGISSFSGERYQITLLVREVVTMIAFRQVSRH